MARRPSPEAVQAWASLVRAQQRVLQAIESDLRQSGLPPLEWYDVLLELERAKDGRLRHRELYPRLLLAKYNLTRLIDRLEQERLVVRVSSQDDARGADITITDSGRALRRRMWPIYAAAIDRHFASKLDREDVATLARILQRLREQVQQPLRQAGVP